jgi:citrate synthase
MPTKELSNRVITSIWKEEARGGNPFYPEKSRCHGYDFYGELLGLCDFIQILYLLLRGEIPDARQRNHLNLLLSAVINPGPRDPSIHIAMAGAVSGVPTGSALSAGLAVAQGSVEGGSAVEETMRWLMLCRQTLLHASNRRSEMTKFLSVVSDPLHWEPVFGKPAPLPGFGRLYGERDEQATRLIGLLKERGFAGFFLRLILAAERRLDPEANGWIRLYGAFAASLLDLGFSPEQGNGLFLIARSGGMLAHLCEQVGRKYQDFPTWFGPGFYRYRGVK